VSLFRFYRQSASVYPVTSANAFNLWGAIAFWRNDSTGDHVLRVAGIPAVRLGTLAFLIGVIVILALAHRALARGANEARVLMVAAASSSLLAYTLLTRMHERYMFLALASLAPLVFVRPLRLAYVALSGLFVLDLWYPFAYFNSGWGVQDLHAEPWFNWILGGFATDTWQKRVWSIAVTGIALLVAWRGARWVGRLQPPADARPVAATPPFDARSLPDLHLHDAEEASPTTLLARLAPLSLVAGTCVLFLVALRGETTPIPNLNDSAFHTQMVRWAVGQIHEGRIPFDGWYPYLSLGSAHFHHYQSLSHIVTAFVAVATGTTADGTYVWLLYLLLALWSLAVYGAMRLFEWSGWTSAAAAAVAPLIVSAPGYGFEHGSYTWQGYGVYSQLWAMWLMPIAWALTWRAIARGRGYAVGACSLALTIALHFITGYLALVMVGVWVVVSGGARFTTRVARGAAVAVGSLLTAAWVLVPLVGDTKWTTQSEYYKGTIYNDSYGASKELAWLVHGQLFDNGRFPIVTLLFVLGASVCVSQARRDPRARALLGAFTVSMVLFFGRKTWGGAIDLLPGMRDIQIHRFEVGVDLAAIMLAGVGLGWVLRTTVRVATRHIPRAFAVRGAPTAAVLLAILVLAPGWTERAHYDRYGSKLMASQRRADATDGRDIDRLIAIVKRRADGRVYAGLRSNWGKEYDIGEVPVYAWLANRDVDAIGFTFRTIASLSTDVEAAFDETNLAQYQMFNVRYLLLPSNHTPPVAARIVARSGRHVLWQVATTGYFQVVDRSTAVSANRTNLEPATRPFRTSNLASRSIYPGVAFAGGAAPQPTFAGTNPPDGSPGRVLTTSETPANGVFSATVVANRTAVVLLKETYDPRWTATVDGRNVKTVMMAPSLVGVEVTAGAHAVTFSYKSIDTYPELFAIGAFALIGLAAFPRRATLRRKLATFYR
jgi:hypothetical protein